MTAAKGIPEETGQPEAASTRNVHGTETEELQPGTKHSQPRGAKCLGKWKQHPFYAYTEACTKATPLRPGEWLVGVFKRGLTHPGTISSCGARDNRGNEETQKEEQNSTCGAPPTGDKHQYRGYSSHHQQYDGNDGFHAGSIDEAHLDLATTSWQTKHSLETARWHYLRPPRMQGGA